MIEEETEESITAEVLAKAGNTADPRMRQINEAAIRHLHAFVREVRPTDAEWERAIGFLTETGQMCSENRQEYILLSDIMGVSTLVDFINHHHGDSATESTVFGPFYVPPPEFENGEDIRGKLDGPPLYVEGRVTSTDGKPVPGATIDIWHSDHVGFYDVQQLDKLGELSGRGRIHADDEGRYRFWTARPKAYPIPNDGPAGKVLDVQGRHPFRPEHVHFMIQAEGLNKLVTQVYAQGDEYLDSDAVFGVKSSLIREYEPHDGGTAPDGKTMDGKWYSLAFDFALSPEAG